MDVVRDHRRTTSRRTYQAARGTTTGACTSSSASRSSAESTDVRPVPFFLFSLFRRCSFILVPIAPGLDHGSRLSMILGRLHVYVRVPACSKSVDGGHPPLPLPLRPAYAARHWRAQSAEPRRHRALRGRRHERELGEPRSCVCACSCWCLSLCSCADRAPRSPRPTQVFDFPYKRSVITWLPRERWFKYDVLAYAEDAPTPALGPAAKPKL